MKRVDKRFMFWPDEDGGCQVIAARGTIAHISAKKVLGRWLCIPLLQPHLWPDGIAIEQVIKAYDRTVNTKSGNQEAK